MEYTVKSRKLRSFVEDYQTRYPKKKTSETVASMMAQISKSNHEIWRRCNICGEEFDARKEWPICRCPACGSTDVSA